MEQLSLMQSQTVSWLNSLEIKTRIKAQPFKIYQLNQSSKI